MPFYTYVAEDGEEIEQFLFRCNRKQNLIIDGKEYLLEKSYPAKHRLVGIYRILNKTNGKVYIGQSKNLQRRMTDYTSCSSHSKQLNEDIKKFGLDNFSFTLIEKCTEEELDKKETEYILKYKSNVYGYNKNKRGKTGPKPEGFGEKIRLTVANRPPKSKETLEKMSKMFSGENNPFYGKKHSKETIERVKQTKKKNGVDFRGERNPSAKPIVCINTGEYFSYSTLAANKYNLDLSTIIKCCKGKRNKTKGMSFKYFEGEEK